ncbi:MAG: hypothetical protein K1X28_10230 [Parachlamydiales bacterium]|nr:hypothetical protein [Parachlamydiales bacterium]
MRSPFLSRITKDFLNLDPDVVPQKERYRMGWGGSVLTPHAESRPKMKAKKQAAERLLALRERFEGLFDFTDSKPIPLSTSPKLTPPVEPPPASFSPPRYFSRGALDKKNPEPIPYLLIETHEMAKARPVPGNTFLFRSLCRGKGTLKKNGQGFIYLDIDNRFITMMLPYLKAQGLIRPPYFNLFDAPEGAHIPVISAREAAFHYLNEIDGLNKEFSFEIEGLYSMEPSSWPEVEQVWFFKVRSTELEDFRRRHFLTEHPNGHDFHIAVAIKPRVGSARYARKAPLMRVNVAFLVA